MLISRLGSRLRKLYSPAFTISRNVEESILPLRYRSNSSVNSDTLLSFVSDWVIFLGRGKSRRALSVICRKSSFDAASSILKCHHDMKRLLIIERRTGIGILSDLKIYVSFLVTNSSSVIVASRRSERLTNRRISNRSSANQCGSCGRSFNLFQSTVSFGVRDSYRRKLSVSIGVVASSASIASSVTRTPRVESVMEPRDNSSSPSDVEIRIHASSDTTNPILCHSEIGISSKSRPLNA